MWRHIDVDMMLFKGYDSAGKPLEVTVIIPMLDIYIMVDSCILGSMHICISYNTFVGPLYFFF